MTTRPASGPAADSVMTIIPSPAGPADAQLTIGATIMIDMPHCMSRLKTISRSFSSELATTSAPLVENGLQSTTELEMARAVISPMAPT